MGYDKLTSLVSWNIALYPFFSTQNSRIVLDLAVGHSRNNTKQRHAWTNDRNVGKYLLIGFDKCPPSEQRHSRIYVVYFHPIPIQFQASCTGCVARFAQYNVGLWAILDIQSATDGKTTIRSQRFRVCMNRGGSKRLNLIRTKNGHLTF